MRLQLPANNWWPREYQKPALNYWLAGGRHLELIWHRRSGKDDVALHGTAIKAMERPATYWHMLPKANQARKAIWDAVNPKTGRRRIDEAFPRELRSATRENEMMIKFLNGATWQVIGSDNFQGAIGSPPAGIVYSEWPQSMPAARGYLRPIIAENGGWELFIGTPRGKNHGYTTFRAAQKNDQAFAQLLSAEQTDVFTPEQLAYERDQYIADYGEDMGLALYEQEYLVSFEAAIIGAIYGAEARKLEQDGRLLDFDFDPNHPVYTVWDIGLDDDTAIWFYQIINGEIRVIDCLSDSGKDLAYYVKQLTGREVAINIRYGKVEVDIGDLVPELWRRSQYDYAGIYIPHDAKAKTLAAQGKSIQEQLNKVFGSNKVCIVPNLSIQDGILAARQMMPRVYMHERCEEGWEALKQYRREWDDKKHMLTDKPVHDWTSHYADAFRYLAVMWREKKEPTVIVPTMTTLTDVTFNDLWQQIPSKRKRI